LDLSDRNIRVAVLEVSGFGGFCYYAHGLCEGLAGQGLTVFQLTSIGNELIDTPRTYELLDIIDRKAGYREQWQTIFNALRKHGVDILHIQSIITARKDILPLALMRLKPFKVVYTAHNVLPHDEKERNAFGMMTVFRLIYRFSDAIITHTRGDREELIRDFSLSPEKISAIPHGNFDFLTAGSGISGDEVRERFSIGEEDLLILVFGAIRRYKGIHLLIEAFAGLSEQNRSARILIVGNRTDPGYADELEQMIAEQGLGERVGFHGEYIRTEDLVGYFEAADCVALPYEHIYDSGVLRLSLSTAKPVLATHVGVFAEIIRDGEHGFLVDPSVAGLASGLSRVLETSRHDLATMGSTARKAFEEEHNWQRIAAETAAIYRTLLPASASSVANGTDR